MIFIYGLLLVLDYFFIRTALPYWFGIKGGTKTLIGSAVMIAFNTIFIPSNLSCSSLLSFGVCGKAVGWPLPYMGVRYENNFFLSLFTAKIDFASFGFFYFILNTAGWLLFFFFLKICYEIYERLYERIFYKKHPLK